MKKKSKKGSYTDFTSFAEFLKKIHAQPIAQWQSDLFQKEYKKLSKGKSQHYNCPCVPTSLEENCGTIADYFIVDDPYDPWRDNPRLRALKEDLEKQPKPKRNRIRSEVLCKILHQRAEEIGVDMDFLISTKTDFPEAHCRWQLFSALSKGQCVALIGLSGNKGHQVVALYIRE